MRVKVDQARRERVELIGFINQFHAPASPRLRTLDDVVLIVAVIDAKREQLHQFARVVLVSRLGRLAVAPAGDGIEVNDHGRAFSADLQQIVERALRV